MKPFRENVAIAIDGGGIRGVMVARALAILEQYLGRPAYTIFGLTVGTSTGAIISAALAAELKAEDIHRLYCTLGEKVFRRSWRTAFWPLTRYRYPSRALEAALKEYIGEKKMGDFWAAKPAIDVVITAYDMVENRTCFIKPWKPSYADWPVVRAVLASCAVPTYFPVVEGRYVDGGVGSYANPCYVAAYEARFCLGWDPAKTTLISLGTGRDPHTLEPGDPNRYPSWGWIFPLYGAFMQSAYDQQVHLVRTFFSKLDFRRFQVDLHKPIAMDDPKKIPILTAYGDELGQMLIEDDLDRALDITPTLPPRPTEEGESTG